MLVFDIGQHLPPHADRKNSDPKMNDHLTVALGAATSIAGLYLWYQYNHPLALPRRKRIAVLGGSFNPPTDGHLLMAANIIHTRSADEVWIVPCGPRPDKPSMTTCARDRLLLTHLAVEATFSSSFPIKVDDEEIERDQALTTPHLLSIYDDKYPESDFYFVIGTDLLDGLHSWDPKYPGWELQRQLIVMDRPGYKPDAKWSKASNVHFLFGSASSASSSFSRAASPRAMSSSSSSSSSSSHSSSSPLKARHVVSDRSFIRMNISSSEVRNRIHYKDNTLQSALGDSSDMIQGLVPHAVLTLTEKLNLYSGRRHRGNSRSSATCSHHDRRSANNGSSSKTTSSSNNNNSSSNSNSNNSNSNSNSAVPPTAAPTTSSTRITRTPSFGVEQTGTLTVGAKDYTVSMTRRQRYCADCTDCADCVDCADYCFDDAAANNTNPFACIFVTMQVFEIKGRVVWR